MILLILTEIGMAMGHGSTCLSISMLYSAHLHKAAGTSRALLDVLTYLCAASLGVGVYLAGSKITKRIGTKFVVYTNTAAFSAQFTAMGVTLLSAVIGYPISTTQSFMFALLGVKLFHNTPEIINMDRRMFKKMIMWWIMAPPVCIFVPFLLSRLIALIVHIDS